MSKKLRIGEMLLKAGILSRQQLEEALNAQLIYGGKLGTNLVEHGFVTEEFLTSFLSKQCDVPAVESRQLEDIPAEVVESISPELASKHKVIPFRKDKRRLDIALVDPTNVEAMDAVAFKTGLLVRPHVAPEVTILRCLERYYSIAKPRRYIEIDGDHSSHKLQVIEQNRQEFSNPHRHELVYDPALPPAQIAPEPLSIAQLVHELQSVDTSPEIVRLILRFGRVYFKNQCMLVLRPDSFQQIASEGTPEFVARTQNLRISIEQQNIVQGIFATKQYHLGTVPPTPENFAILEQFGEDPTAIVFVLPLVYNQRVEFILFAGGFSHSFMFEHVRRFQLVMEKAGLAHQIILLKNRLRLLPDDLQEVHPDEAGSPDALVEQVG
jgi:hypothetical protein